MAEAAMSLTVKGLPELIKKLDQLKVDTEKAVAAALMASALRSRRAADVIVFSLVVIHISRCCASGRAARKLCR
jgi:hypothetical protein